MKRKLPKGEETLPIAEVEGKFLTLQELREQQPELYRSLLGPRALELRVSDELLIKRYRMRVAQGRGMTIYFMPYPGPMELSPEKQVEHVERRTEIGKWLIDGERLLLAEELSIIREMEM